MSEVHIHTLNEVDIEAHKCEPVEIKVTGSGTTGYLWNIEADQERVKIIDHKLEPSDESFGASGEESFVLEPLAEGETKVRFTLTAPWEAEPAEVHVINLKCTPND